MITEPRRSRPVRILRISTRLNIGGPAIHAMLLTNRMGPPKFETLLVTGEPDATEGDLRELIWDETKRLIPVKALKRSIQPLNDVRSLVHIMQVIWKERPDIIHTHMAKAGALGRVAGILYNCFGHGRNSGTRTLLIHTFHGHVLEGYFPKWISRFFIMIERWLSRYTDCLIAVSNSVRDELLAKGIGRPDKWRVVPLGLDLSQLARLPISDSCSHIRIGIIGRLVPIKNHSLFLNALSQLRKENVQVRGVIVGDGLLRQSLEAQVEELNLKLHVQFTGWRRDLHVVYNELQIVCLTSLNEGTPVALIEAMAAGRAVVATDVGGVRDLLVGDKPFAKIPAGGLCITDRGVLTRPGDVNGVTRALKVLAQNEKLRLRLGKAARTYALEHFTAERLVSNITALYEELLKKE